MKTKTKFILLGILSLLVGSAFATPLLITELEIVPFWTMPQGPKTVFTAKIVYANFSIQNDLPKYDKNLGDYNISKLDYSIVLNITNLAGLSAKLSNIGFASMNNISTTPSALGGFHVLHQDGGSVGSSFITRGPTEGYLGHVGAGRVEGLWLDGKWLNTTWVPDGGLDQIWRSENIFPPKGLESIWEYNWLPYENINYQRELARENPDFDLPPYSTFGGSRMNETRHYYTYGGRIFTFEGRNCWIEGVPLREYVADNQVKATLIYTDGSWIDVSGRVEVEEVPFVIASDLFFGLQTSFYEYQEKDNVFPSGHFYDFSSIRSSPLSRDFSFYEFDNVWKPYQSRLILFNGSRNIGNLWKPDELLKDNELEIYLELHNFVSDNFVDGIEVNTASIITEFEKIELERIDDYYQYNLLNLEDQKLVLDSFGIEVLNLVELGT